MPYGWLGLIGLRFPCFFFRLHPSVRRCAVDRWASEAVSCSLLLHVELIISACLGFGGILALASPPPGAGRLWSMSIGVVLCPPRMEPCPSTLLTDCVGSYCGWCLGLFHSSIPVGMEGVSEISPRPSIYFDVDVSDLGFPVTRVPY